MNLFGGRTPGGVRRPRLPWVREHGAVLHLRCRYLRLARHRNSARRKVTDKRMFNVDTGKDDGGVYVRLWELDAEAKMHGNIYWISDTLVTCIQVNPLLLWNSTIPLVLPVVRVLPGSNYSASSIFVTSRRVLHFHDD